MLFFNYTSKNLWGKIKIILISLIASLLPSPIPICSTPATIFYYPFSYFTPDILISLLISQDSELLLLSQLLHCCLTVRNSFPEIYVGLKPSFYSGLYSNTTFSEMPSLSQTILKYHLACYLCLLNLPYFLFLNTFHQWYNTLSQVGNINQDSYFSFWLTTV